MKKQTLHNSPCIVNLQMYIPIYKSVGHAWCNQVLKVQSTSNHLLHKHIVIKYLYIIINDSHACSIRDLK